MQAHVCTQDGQYVCISICPTYPSPTSPVNRNIRLKTAYPVQEKEPELQYTYLDTTGRPVVIAIKVNLVEQHIQDFEVLYEFEAHLLLLEPLVVTAALYMFFLLVIILVRLDFTISEVGGRGGERGREEGREGRGEREEERGGGSHWHGVELGVVFKCMFHP